MQSHAWHRQRESEPPHTRLPPSARSLRAHMRPPSTLPSPFSPVSISSHAADSDDLLRQFGIAVANQDHTPDRDGEMAFVKGDVVNVNDNAVANRPGWWWCTGSDGRAGLVDGSKFTVLSDRCDGRAGLAPKPLMKQLSKTTMQMF